jgi:hypothetical protein
MPSASAVPRVLTLYMRHSDSISRSAIWGGLEPCSMEELWAIDARLREYVGRPCSLCNSPLPRECVELAGRPYCHPCGWIAAESARLRAAASP